MMHHADVLTRVLKILGKRGSLICFTVLIQDRFSCKINHKGTLSFTLNLIKRSLYIASEDIEKFNLIIFTK